MWEKPWLREYLHQERLSGQPFVLRALSVAFHQLGCRRKMRETVEMALHEKMNKVSVESVCQCLAIVATQKKQQQQQIDLSKMKLFFRPSDSTKFKQLPCALEF